MADPVFASGDENFISGVPYDIVIACSDETTALVKEANTQLVKFYPPRSFTIQAISISVNNSIAADISIKITMGDKQINIPFNKSYGEIKVINLNVGHPISEVQSIIISTSDKAYSADLNIKGLKIGFIGVTTNKSKMPKADPPITCPIQ